MTIRLTRLDASFPIANPDGTPTLQFLRLYNKTVESVETAFNGLEDQVTAIAAAQTSADAAIRRVAIAGSFTTGSAAPLTASDAGASATITIDAHVRNYSAETDYPARSLSGGSITGLAYSTTYYVYYDDPTLADTTPAYLATTTPSQGQANIVTGRHPLGPITTPAAAAPPVTGGGSSPPAGGAGTAAGILL